MRIHSEAARPRPAGPAARSWSPDRQVVKPASQVVKPASQVVEPASQVVEPDRVVEGLAPRAA